MNIIVKFCFYWYYQLPKENKVVLEFKERKHLFLFLDIGTSVL